MLFASGDRLRSFIFHDFMTVVFKPEKLKFRPCFEKGFGKGI